MPSNSLQTILDLSTNGIAAQDIEMYSNGANLILSVNVDGIEKQSIHPMIVIPFIVEAIQELSTQLDSALARIAALEGSP